MLRRLVMSGTVVMLAGCYSLTPPESPSVAGHTVPSAAFCGIKHSLDSTKAARLLIIHGMGWHDFGYDEGFRELLTVALEVKPRGCAGPYPIEKPDDPYNSYGNVLFCTYIRNDGARLRTYTLLWDPLTRPYKVTALQYDWDSPYAEWRTTANGPIKESLIDKSFSDAVLDSGQLAEAMQYSVRQALCAAMTDETNLGVECSASPTSEARVSDVFAATHSLGSIMLFETLGTTTAGPTAPAANAFADRLQLVGMMANQLPLITISRLKRPPPDAPLRRTSPLFLSLFMPRTTKVKVAAFYDVNDLLSYAVPENWDEVLFPDAAKRFTFINYPVTNARYAWGFAIANPARAHTGYWSHPWVINALAFGYGCRP